jgi:hypothetical protein
MADKTVFTRLKRLFSTDVVIRNVGDNQLKVLDVNQIQKSGEIRTNSLVDRFTRLRTTNAGPIYNPALNYQVLRTQLYSDYEAMDTDAIIASALDIVADESTLKNEMGEVLTIRSTDENIQKTLYNLFYDILNIEFNLWSWVRSMAKFGDFFLKLEIAEKYGIYNIIPYSAYNMSREEAYDKENPSSVRFKMDPDGLAGGGYYGGIGQNDQTAIYFDNYEVAHFRLTADPNYLPYGRSYVEPARKLFKQYTLMEDAMLLHRIIRAPEKRTFYLNVGSIPPQEVDAFVEKQVTALKRQPYIDQQTGEYNLKFNVQNMMEDFIIPVRGNDTSTKIETTPGLQYDGITDVEYLRDKLFAALKVPKAFMGYDQFTDGKATLAAQDIRFARTIERIQRIIVSELYKIALVHLYTQGYKSEQLVNFELSLTSPSIIYDQERVALLKEKMELANAMKESNLFSSDWIYDNVFRLSEEQYDEMRDLVREDKKREFRLTQIENEGNDPAESGKSYGTPHDLASLYGQGRYQTNSNNVPEGYNEEEPELGRPKEKISNRNTQKDNFGKDRLGVSGMKRDYNDPQNVSPLTLESKKEYERIKKHLPNLGDKKLIFESKNKEAEYLKEKNIRNL